MSAEHEPFTREQLKAMEEAEQFVLAESFLAQFEQSPEEYVDETLDTLTKKFNRIEKAHALRHRIGSFTLGALQGAGQMISSHTLYIAALRSNSQTPRDDDKNALQ